MDQTRIEMKRARDWLAGGGLRPTRQRVILAQLLVGDSLDRHVSAESLFAAANEVVDRVSLATVYNTLSAFCRAGLLREINVNGAKSHFDTRIDDHPHFFWENSGKLTDAPVEGLKISQLPAAPAGTEISKVDVVIRVRET